MMLTRLTLLLATALPLVLAQFHFFDNIFGQHAQQQHQQRPSGPSQWAAHSESSKYTDAQNFARNLDIWVPVQCSNYLCPTTLDCVVNPSDCPCPVVEDIKCIIPDKLMKGAASVVCVRGDEGCSQVERLMRPWTH
jgi:hypothetical protein